MCVCVFIVSEGSGLIFIGHFSKINHFYIGQNLLKPRYNQDLKHVLQHNLCLNVNERFQGQIFTEGDGPEELWQIEDGCMGG